MMKTTKELARELGLLRKRSASSASQCLKRIKKTNQLFSYLIVMDFESTCWKDMKYRTQEVIEFPAVLLNTSTGQIEAEFHHYVMPQESPILSDFCRELTGITQSQVDEGIPISLCLRRFSLWLENFRKTKGLVYGNVTEPGQKGCTFVTWSDWDLGVCLQYECRRKQIRKPVELNSWIDLRATYRKFYERRPNGLNGALQDLGIEFEGREHSGLHDARNTARLAWRMMCDGCVMKITKTLHGPTKSLTAGGVPGYSEQRTGKQTNKDLCTKSNENITKENIYMTMQAGKSEVIQLKTLDTKHTGPQKDTDMEGCENKVSGLATGSKKTDPRCQFTKYSHREPVNQTNNPEPLQLKQDTIRTGYRVSPSVVGCSNSTSQSSTYGYSSTNSTESGNVIEHKIPSMTVQKVVTKPYCDPAIRSCKDNVAHTSWTGKVERPGTNGNQQVDVGRRSGETVFKVPSPPSGITHATCASGRKPFGDANSTINTPSNHNSFDKNSFAINSKCSMLKTPTNILSNASAMKRTPPMCGCGRRATRKIVQSPGPNMGRAFFCCPAGQRGAGRSSGCKFFKWDSPTTDSTIKSSWSTTSRCRSATSTPSSVSIMSYTNSIPQPNFDTPQSEPKNSGRKTLGVRSYQNTQTSIR